MPSASSSFESHPDNFDIDPLIICKTY